jgi:hypothetical protein
MNGLEYSGTTISREIKLYHMLTLTTYCMQSPLSKCRLTFPDGRKLEVDVKAGSVGWMKAHIYIGENIGDTDTDVIIVELKEICR